MKSEKVINLIKERNIVIPIYVYKLFPKLDIDLETFIFLMYLNSKGENFIFDPQVLQEEFGCEFSKIMEYISNLQGKNIIELKVIKNEKNIMEEYISLDLFYEKISKYLIEDINNTEDNITNIFEMLEQELGKQLTPIEYEIVKAWKENNYSDEVIKEAIKEAVYNNVASLRYIDKILYEWSKKGIKTKEAVEKNKKEFKDEKERQKQKKIDVFEYDWMEDSEN